MFRLWLTKVTTSYIGVIVSYLPLDYTQEALKICVFIFLTCNTYKGNLTLQVLPENWITLAIFYFSPLSPLSSVSFPPILFEFNSPANQNVFISLYSFFICSIFYCCFTLATASSLKFLRPSCQDCQHHQYRHSDCTPHKRTTSKGKFFLSQT